MGLKGKIEAIIYAAEEPVSLEQIALLVKEPALQELAEERARAEAEEAAAKEQQEGVAVDASWPEAPENAPQTEAVEAGTADAGAVDAGTAATDVLEQTAVAGESIPAESETAPSVDAVPPEAGEKQVASEPVENVGPELSQSAVQGEGSAESQGVSQAAEVGASPDAVAGAERSGGTEASSPQTDVSPAQEQPRAEASENAKPAVASKRRAKADIPPEVRSKVRSVVEELIADYTNPERGMEIRQIAGGYRMTTKPEHHDVVKAFAKSLKPPLRLSLPALETLAVIAYKQPVTAPEVSEIRGVDSQGVIATLLDRKLITTAGRKAVIGRPILYKTTKEFLLRFGLNEIAELPSMEEFEKLALEAGQVDMFQADDGGETPTDEGSAGTEASSQQLPATEAEDSPEANNAADAEQQEPSGEQPQGEDQVPESSDRAENNPAKSEEPVH